MYYTFVFEKPLDAVIIEARTIYGALRKLAQYMIENNRLLCNLVPYYRTPKRCFYLKQIHINFISKELLT